MKIGNKSSFTFVNQQIGQFLDLLIGSLKKGEFYHACISSCSQQNGLRPSIGKSSIVDAFLTGIVSRG